MADLLQSGASWLVGQLADNASQTVTYRRGGLSVSLTATKCPVRSEIDQQFGVLRITQCDWIIKASLLILGGETVEPMEASDVIVESDGTEWQVLPIEGESHYRPLDPYRTAWRIHTKRMTVG